MILTFLLLDPNFQDDLPACRPLTSCCSTSAYHSLHLSCDRNDHRRLANSQVWFAQVEAQFTTCHITNQCTFFNRAVTSLAPEYVTKVRTLILSLPKQDAHNTLKALLIQRTAASEQRRPQTLFISEELGDCKPTQHPCHMQQLVGDSTGPTSDSSFPL